MSSEEEKSETVPFVVTEELGEAIREAMRVMFHAGSTAIVETERAISPEGFETHGEAVEKRLKAVGDELESVYLKRSKQLQKLMLQGGYDSVTKTFRHP